MAVVAVSLGGAAVRKADVSILGESEDAGKIKRAIALDPSDAELHHRLGLVQFDFGSRATDRIGGIETASSGTQN